MVQCLSERAALAGRPGSDLSIFARDSQLPVTTALGTYTHTQTHTFSNLFSFEDLVMYFCECSICMYT